MDSSSRYGDRSNNFSSIEAIVSEIESDLEIYKNDAKVIIVKALLGVNYLNNPIFTPGMNGTKQIILNRFTNLSIEKKQEILKLFLDQFRKARDENPKRGKETDSFTRKFLL